MPVPHAHFLAFGFNQPPANGNTHHPHYSHQLAQHQHQHQHQNQNQHQHQHQHQQLLQHQHQHQNHPLSLHQHHLNFTHPLSNRSLTQSPIPFPLSPPAYKPSSHGSVPSAEGIQKAHAHPHPYPPHAQPPSYILSPNPIRTAPNWSHPTTTFLPPSYLPPSEPPSSPGSSNSPPASPYDYSPCRCHTVQQHQSAPPQRLPAPAPAPVPAPLPGSPMTPVLRKGAQFGLALHDFERVRTLGTGTFGRVVLVRLRPSKAGHGSREFYALKVLAKSEVVRLKQVEHVGSEKDLLALVASTKTAAQKFCVSLFCTFQDARNVYMAMEFVQGGELFSHLRRAGRFAVDVARFFAANVVLALEGLHALDIVYRDLKPENILLSANGYIKLTDFGFAKRVVDRTWTLCGTPEYLAPEIITSKGHGKPADWWALGVLVFEMLAGFPPFFAHEGQGAFAIYEKILAAELIFPPGFGMLAADLIRRLLTADRSRRIGNLRGGPRDVKEHEWFEGVDWNLLAQQAIRAPILPKIGRPGDSSNFEQYPEVRIEDMPGMMGPTGVETELGPGGEGGEADPYGHLFESF